MRSLERIIARLIAAAAMAAVLSSMAAAQDLDATLQSTRWPGLSLKYPASLLRVIRPEDDSRKDPRIASINDVDVLRAHSDSFVVYLGGSFNEGDAVDADGQLDLLLQWDKEPHPSAAVTYRAHKGNWAVASGTFGGAGNEKLQYFYYKVVARCATASRAARSPRLSPP